MRCVRSFAGWAALLLLGASLGCGGDDGKKDSGAGANGAAPKANGNETSSGQPAASGGNTAALDTSYIMPDDYAVLVLKPRRIVESPVAAKLLKDPQVAAAVENFGIAPQDVEQFSIAFAMVEFRPGHPEPMPTAVAHFSRDLDTKDVVGKLSKVFGRGGEGKELEIGGKKCYSMGSGDAIVYVPDSRTVILSNEVVLKKIIAGDAAKGALADRMAKADADNDLILLAAPEASPEFLKELPSHMNEVPPPLQALAANFKDMKNAEVTLSLKGDSLLRLVVEAVDEKAAGAVQELLEGDVKMAGGALAGIKQSMPPEMRDKLAPLLKLANQIIDSVKIDKQGAVVSLAAKRPAEFDEVVGSQIDEVKKLLQGEAEPGSRAPTRRTTSIAMNNLRQIGLAASSYLSDRAVFPTAAITKDGKPMLSWRVAILPYLDEADLYKQFHLDEPWDSPNNIKLLDKMPKVYQTAGHEGDGKTAIEVFTGKDTVLGGDRALGNNDIHDGFSQTILAVVAGPDKAVPWTKPEDLPFDPKNPGAALGNVPADGFLTVFCDGAVYRVPKTIDAESLKGLITPAGSELVDKGKLEGGN